MEDVDVEDITRDVEWTETKEDALAIRKAIGNLVKRAPGRPRKIEKGEVGQTSLKCVRPKPSGDFQGESSSPEWRTTSAGENSGSSQ